MNLNETLRAAIDSERLKLFKMLTFANQPKINHAGPIPRNRRGRFKQNARRQNGRKVL